MNEIKKDDFDYNITKEKEEVVCKLFILIRIIVGDRLIGVGLQTRLNGKQEDVTYKHQNVVPMTLR